MGRAPCCDKANVKKGPWSPEEDAKLKSYIEQHGTGGNWIALPQKIGLKRCGKSCRLRWLNYLRPNIKHGGFSEEEDNIICSLYISIGSRWSIIAAQLPGRTDNDIKNYWNTRLKKKLLGKQRKEQAARRISNASQKQEMLRKGMRESNGYNLLSANSSDHHHQIHSILAENQNPYWPELPAASTLPPIPYSNEELRFHNNDHASIRKLLIKLGGKFASDDDDIIGGVSHIHDEYPLGNNPTSAATQPFYADHHHHDHHQQEEIIMVPGAANLYNIDGGDFSTASFHAEIEEMMYNINPQKLEGLEFLCGDNLMMTMNMNTRMNNNGSLLEWGGSDDHQIMSSCSSSMVNVVNPTSLSPAVVLGSSCFESLELQGSTTVTSDEHDLRGTMGHRN